MALCIGSLLCGCSAGRSSSGEVILGPEVEVVYGSRAETFDTIVETLVTNVPQVIDGAPSVEALAPTYRGAALDAPNTEAFYAVVEAMIAELQISHVGVVPPIFSSSSLPSSPPSEEADAADRLNNGEADEPPAPTPPLPTPGSGAGVAGFDVRLLGDTVVVSSVVPGSGADVAGIKAGMTLKALGGVGVDGVLVRSKEVPEAERPLFVRESILRGARGPVGATLEVDIAPPDGDRASLSLTLSPWEGQDSRFGHIVLSGAVSSREVAPGIGYVSLSVFAFDLMKDVEAAITGFQGADGLILDLRGNLGGVAGMSQAVAGFLTDEPLSLGRSDGMGMELEYVVFPRPTAFTGPLVCLVDGLSASTSEILAAGLQGTGRGTVIGTQTAGMVLPSMVVRLPDGGLLQYATSVYITPAGDIPEGVGVTPDIPVAMDPWAWYRGEDPALDKAIEFIKAGPGP